MRIRCIKCNTITFLPSGKGKCNGCGRFLNAKRPAPASSGRRFPASFSNLERKSPLSSNFSIGARKAAFSTGPQTMRKSPLSSDFPTEGLLGNIFGLVNRLQDLSEKKTSEDIKVKREGKIHILGQEFDLSPAITAFKKEQRRKEARLKIEPKELEVELHDEPDRVMLVIDLTGFEREETVIDIKPDSYIITTKDRDKKTHQKVIPNPPQVDASKSEEHFKGGILSIILPKSKQKKN